MTQPATEIRSINCEETYPLRLDVLRPGRRLEAAQFPGDDDPATRHFGAFREGKLLAIATLLWAELPEQPELVGYQLRGMATAPEARKTGLGRQVLLACADYVRQSGVPILWCNARISAVGFYRKAGFEIIGAEFDIPDVGPHFRMVLKV